VLTFSLEHPKAVLLINGSLSLIVNGVLGPLIEETYFRGYLLPRLSRLEKKGVFLNVILFAIYHFWTPWRVIKLTLLTLVLGLIVWWKKKHLLRHAATHSGELNKRSTENRCHLDTIIKNKQ
jgi:membrane protease YdiL (CAAX protease family)